MGEILIWNLIIITIVCAFTGFFSREGERWIGVQVIFYTSLFLSVCWWAIVVAILVVVDQ